MKSRITTVLFIFLLAAIASFPLLKPGLYTMHDDQQVARLFVFDEALKAGQFPVRWVDHLGFGFGYPLFVFYPPVVYMLGELFHLTGFSFIESIKIVFFLSIFLSGLSMYIFARHLFGTLASLVGAAFYIFVPYRALDVYVRGALAESFALVWPPLIMWATLKIFKMPTFANAVLLTIFLGALMLTHNLILLPFILIFSLMILSLVYMSSNKKKFFLHTLFGVVGAALLTIFFWLPAITEKQFTIVDELLIVNLADYKIHFVYPNQLWDWTWGFGGSSQGLLDGISFKIGKLHIVISLISLVIELWLFLKLKPSSKSKSNEQKLIITFFIMFVFSAFMTTQYSDLIWELIKPLAYLQFPWRFLAFTALFSSILAAAFIHSLKITVLKLAAATVLVFALLLSNIKLFKPQHYRQSIDDAYMTSTDVVSWDVSQSSFEYSPKGIKLVKNSMGANTIDISKSDVPESKLTVSDGIAQLVVLENKPHEVKFVIEAQDNATITANVFDFPGWQLVLDGEKKSFNSNNKHKLIIFEVDKGSHTGDLKFKNTPLRNFANLISTISFLILLGYLSKQWLILKHK